MKVSLIKSIESAKRSWHVMEAGGGEFLAHTAVEQLVTDEWFELYPEGELVVECEVFSRPEGMDTKGEMINYELSVSDWGGPKGKFELRINNVKKGLALTMFLAAYRAHCQNQ